MSARSALQFSPGAAGPFLKEARPRFKPPHWSELARCTEVDSETFFPVAGESAWPARRVCARCEVQAPCLRYALKHPEEGVWGGLQEFERRRLGPDPSPEDFRAALDGAGRKTCTRCHEEKDVDEFPVDEKGSPIHNCRPCRNAKDREKGERSRMAVTKILERAA